MSEENKKTSIAKERMLTCYPPPKYHTLFVGFTNANEMNKSEAMTEILRSFFDNMNEGKRKTCMNEGIRVKSKNSY